jgi:small subunit ribosomal protein S17
MRLTGRVVGDKPDKTITVVVDRLVKHPVVKKYIKKQTRCMAHDEKNEACEGDLVRIVECRPFSKRKRWLLEDVLRKETRK